MIIAASLHSRSARDWLIKREYYKRHSYTYRQVAGISNWRTHRCRLLALIYSGEVTWSRVTRAEATSVEVDLIQVNVHDDQTYDSAHYLMTNQNIMLYF